MKWIIIYLAVANIVAIYLDFSDDQNINPNAIKGLFFPFTAIVFIVCKIIDLVEDA